MWPTFWKTTPRRQEIRRSKVVRTGPWYRRIAPIRTWIVVVALLTAAVSAVTLNTGGTVLALHEGQRLTHAYTARVDLKIEDRKQTEEMRVRARDSSPNYYKLDTSLIEDLRGRLLNALTLARAHTDDVQRLREAAREHGVVLDEAAAAELVRFAAQDDVFAFQQFVDSALRVLRNQPIVSPDNVGVAQRRAASRAVLIDPQAPQQRTVEMNRLVFTSDEQAVQRALSSAAAPFPEPLRDGMRASIARILAAPDAPEDQLATIRPLYRYDAARTAAVAEQAERDVSTQYIEYKTGAILADAGKLAQDEIELLQIEHDEYERWMRENRAGLLWLQALGRALLAFLIVGGVALYMARYQHGVLTRRVRGAVSLVALVAVLVASRFAFVGLELPAHAVVGLQGFAAALLGIVYAHGAVFAICGGLALLITLGVQQGVGFFLVLMAVSATFLFGLRRVRNRGKIVLVGVVAAAVACFTSIMVGLVQQQTGEFLLYQSLWASSITLLAALLVEGILPGIERAFRLSTDMTLLEWCDASKPLLRMMAAEAPGTYNHSLLVGALAEAAAEAVGVNGLLARAGAYYHDIGKINKPEYFVENQTAGASRHERLSPAMSLLIIVGHVKDGIEMAREYGLPETLLPFIAEHHGTTLVEYFYDRATRQRRIDDPEVSDTEFRYPGPKPQSRATAILMLCDGVESAVRAMPEPTPNRIEAIVSNLIQKRLMDGQFDECDLTFRELAVIEKRLVKSLCSIYHARIAYPDKSAAGRAKSATRAS